jgi:hypothetical protein
MNKSLPWLRSIQTPADVVERLEEFSIRPTVRSMEAHAYALARAGHLEKARHEFGILCHTCDDRIVWHREVRENAERVIVALDAGPDVTENLLSGFEQFTLEALRLRRQ